MLVFAGLGGLMLDPESALSDWGPRTDGEILKIEASRVTSECSSIKLVILRTDYDDHREEICVLNFDAACATWEPHRV